LFVIARHSVFTYKGKAVKVQEVSKELGVQYVLEGSVQKTDGQVRINAQLVDATTGRHLWAERYDRPFKDIFALQDDIIHKIVTTLKLQFTLHEQGVVRPKRTDNLEAYDALLRGLEYHYRFTPEANAQARQLFERAIVLDPVYAEAYAELGFTYFLEWTWKWSQDPQALERSDELVQKAIALDDSLARAHGFLGFVYAQQHQYEQAAAEADRAVALAPNNAESYAMQADVLLFASRGADALRSIEQALRLNPRYPAVYLQELGGAYQQTGRYAEAITTYKQLLVRNPNFLYAYVNLAYIYIAQWAFQLNEDPQILEQALTAAQRAVALNDSLARAHLGLGSVYLYQKHYEQALAELERAIALDPNGALNYAILANALSCVGRPEDALRMVEQALRLQPFVADEHLFGVGSAYALAGRYEEAIAPLKQVLTRYPNIPGPHLNLAVAYSALGKEAEAQAEAAEVLRLNPQFSLEVHKERAPIKEPAMLERHIAALRKAGLK
jgi:tetratricopeptide (TPR) repeat protein